MTDGLNGFHHDPMRWAVDTVIEGNVEADGQSASELVDYVWEFIVACFENEGLPLVDKGAVIMGVDARLRDG